MRARVALSALLASCSAALPWDPVRVCDEIRAAAAARQLECDGDGDGAIALSDGLDASVPCTITGYDPRGAALQPAVTTESGVAVELEAAYHCAEVARELPCGTPDARRVWAALVEAAPECEPLRSAEAISDLPECDDAGELKLCPDALPFADAVAACASANRVLWNVDPDGLPGEVLDLGETWLGLTMETCPDPVACVQMWTWIDGGGYLDRPTSRFWGPGEPEPTTLGTAVWVSLAGSAGGSIETWYAAPPTEAHAFVCR